MLRPAFLRIPFDARSQELINCRPLLVGRIATRTILNTRASVRPAPFLRNDSGVIRTRGAIRTFSDAVNDPQAVSYIITVPIGGLLAAVLVCKVLIWLGLMDDPMDHRVAWQREKQSSSSFGEKARSILLGVNVTNARSPHLGNGWRSNGRRLRS